MNDATHTSSTRPEPPWPDRAFDLTRGIAAYTGSSLVGRLARTMAKHPQARLDDAFNHKQIASKLWARNELIKAAGRPIERIWILGGWYGVLAAMLFEEPRLEIGRIVSVDIDREVAPVALTLNAPHVSAGRFEAKIADMYRLDYRGADRPDLVINTSCEHIPDLRRWLDLLPRGLAVLLQSNDYFAEPEHVSSMASLEAFRGAAALSRVQFAGSLRQPKYTRFMLIGEV